MTETKAPRAEIVNYQEFQKEMQAREAELAAILPSHISRERFMNTAIVAVKHNLELLKCNSRQLHAAITKAAQDGLLPDGREGAILTFWDKDKKIHVAQWMPMIYGVRKRAREICGMIIDAQIVCEKDTFIWKQGDEPSIEHRPAQLGTDRGKKIGVYAIFKQDGEILHREVLDTDDVAAIKSISRAQTGLMWTKFEKEAWRKSAVRRGIKSVPSISSDLERIVLRDDEHVDLEPRAVSIQAIEPPEPPAPPMPPEPPAIVDQTPPEFNVPAFMANLEDELCACQDEEALGESWAQNELTMEDHLDRNQRDAALDIYKRHEARLNGQIDLEDAIAAAPVSSLKAAASA